METEYDKQAKKFLEETKTTMQITVANPQLKPNWIKENEKHGIDYVVTLKNDRHRYTFHFWDSIANKEKEIKPTEYDVIVSLNLLQGNEDIDFNDFCAEFGYDNDSRMAEKIWIDCIEQNKQLRLLWNDNELEKLTEII